MSLYKAIEHHKEHRQPYRKSKAFDVSCRNHGSCTWCESNRLYNNRKRDAQSLQELKDFKKDNMKEEILHFIRGFQNFGKQVIELFSEGYCYWFAFILYERFVVDYPDNIAILYNPIDNHFACLIEGTLYDITGEITYNDNWTPWDDYDSVDKLDYARVCRYCIDKRIEN